MKKNEGAALFREPPSETPSSQSFQSFFQMTRESILPCEDLHAAGALVNLCFYDTTTTQPQMFCREEKKNDPQLMWFNLIMKY